MYGKTYIQRAKDAEQRVRGDEMQARTALMQDQIARLNLTAEDMRELAQIALDTKTPLRSLLTELEQMRKEERGHDHLPAGTAPHP